MTIKSTTPTAVRWGGIGVYRRDARLVEAANQERRGGEAKQSASAKETTNKNCRA